MPEALPALSNDNFGLPADFGLPDLGGGGGMGSLGGDTPLPTGTPRKLTRKQKAAIIIRLLVSEGVHISLTDLPDELQAELAQQMSRMRFIDRVTLKSVIDEFIAEIDDIALSFPNGIEGALKVLEGTISAGTAARMRKSGGISIYGDPWETVSGIDPDKLMTVLEEESTEVAAVLLSKLKVSVAADLLSRLPGPRARRIAYAVSLTRTIQPEVVERIGVSLAHQLDAQPIHAFADGPVERIGAILNFSTAAARDEVLDGLDQDDAAFAREVRKAIFTFANIPERIDPRDVPKITKGADQSVLVKALLGAGTEGPLYEAAEFILAGISKRMAEQIRDEMKELGSVKPQEGEEAMADVVNAIRQLEADGELIFLSGDDDA
ncbi:MAG: FliG C-terminal domain-containing protein [Maritimibacter sp.]